MEGEKDWIYRQVRTSTALMSLAFLKSYLEKLSTVEERRGGVWGREEMYGENNSDIILLNSTYLCLYPHDCKDSQSVSSYKAKLKLFLNCLWQS